MSNLTTAAPERYQPPLSQVERTTLLGFRGFTREAYTLGLRQFAAGCWQLDRHLFDVRVVDIECSARDVEDRRSARSNRVMREQARAVAPSRSVGEWRGARDRYGVVFIRSLAYWP
jgi:hypothetical protein